MIVVVPRNYLGIGPPHSVVPIKVEQWRKTSKDGGGIYYKTFVINPTSGGIEEMPTSFWQKTANVHSIFKP